MTRARILVALSLAAGLAVLAAVGLRAVRDWLEYPQSGWYYR